MRATAWGLLALVLVVSLVGMTPVAADHGDPANYTVIPKDRTPGITDAPYRHHSTAPTTIEYLDYMRATWEPGGFSNCGMGDTKTLGIDRGNDDPGTHVDKQLAQHVKSSTVTEDKFVVEFYDKDEFGSSTYFNAGDEFVSVTRGCMTNPSEPGRYQIQSTVGGTAPNGSYIEVSATSHYFAICDCATEKEAREQLGPPPSASSGATADDTRATGTATATSEPTPTRTPPAGTPFPTPAASTTTATATTPEADAASRGGATAAESAAESPTSTKPESWAAVRTTPTIGTAPGFTPLLSIAALVAVLVVIRGRDRR